MVDKSELLGDLQIDRDAPKKSNRPIYLFIVIAVAAGLLFGAYSWWSFSLRSCRAYGTRRRRLDNN